MLIALLGCATVRPVDISVVGATVGPSAADLSPWDGLGPVPAELRASAIASASHVDANAGAAAAAFVDLLDGVAPPDPMGEVWTAGHEAETVPLAERADTFVPAWSDATLRGVLLAPDVRLFVRLLDADLDAPDTIATVTLDARDLRAALRAKDTWTVNTADRSAGQLLSVTLRVDPSATAAAP